MVDNLSFTLYSFLDSVAFIYLDVEHQVTIPINISIPFPVPRQPTEAFLGAPAPWYGRHGRHQHRGRPTATTSATSRVMGTTETC